MDPETKPIRRAALVYFFSTLFITALLFIVSMPLFMVVPDSFVNSASVVISIIITILSCWLGSMWMRKGGLTVPEPEKIALYAVIIQLTIWIVFGIAAALYFSMPFTRLLTLEGAADTVSTIANIIVFYLASRYFLTS